MSGAIRVLLVDDSALARSMLRAILEEAGGFEVIAEAENGRAAVEAVLRLKPHLVTMDLDMPVMGGQEAIEEIMASRAVPILVVSGVADARNAYQAVAAGAVEVVNKPSLSPPDIAAFVAKARLVAKVPVITHIRALRVRVGTAPVPVAKQETSGGGERVFAIASSTGGPQALAQILASLPASFSCPVVIAQHISEGFAAGMAQWLATLSPMPVRLGRDGEPLAAGTVYIAPSETNMTVLAARRLALIARGPSDLHHPSCDALLGSVAAAVGRRAVGIILTGMGSDGARGMERVKAAGGATLAQDEASSVIFGMNRVAIERGAVDTILALDALAAAMITLAREPVGAGEAG